MSSRIQAIKIKTKDEFAEDTSIGMYEVKNTSDYPQSANMLALWRMNKGTGSTIFDDQGNYNGTILGASWVASREGFGKALSFDGDNDRVLCGDVSAFNNAEVNWTIALHFYLPSTIAGVLNYLCYKHKDANNYFHVYYNATTERMVTEFKKAGTVGSGESNTSSDDFNFDGWNTMVIQYDGSQALADRVNYFINTTIPVVNVSGTIPTSMPDLSPFDFYLGWAATSLDGYMDNVTIWDVTLTPTEAAVWRLLEPSPAHLRWIKTTPENATTLTWKQGMFMKPGISPREQGFDGRRRGRKVQAGNMNVTIDNSSQFWKTLDDDGIELKGARSELWEFLDDGADPGGSQKFAGKVKDIDWNENSYFMLIQNGWDDRIANLSTIIDTNDSRFTNAPDEVVGDTVPITYGQLDKAKFLRTQLSAVSIANTSFNGLSGFDSDSSGAIGFKVTATGTGVEYTIQIANSMTVDSLPNLQTYLIGKFIKGIEGTGKGTFREITAVDSAAADGKIEIVLKYYMEAPFSTTTTWVSIVDYALEYRADIESCQGLINEDPFPLILTSNFILYAFDESYVLVPQYGLNVVGGNNQLNATPNFFLTDPSQLDSFLIYPVVNPIPIPDVEEFGGEPRWTKLNEGIFKWSNLTTHNAVYFDGEFDPHTDMIDKNINTANQLYVKTYHTSENEADKKAKYLVGWTFEFPEYPDGVQFDNFYILSKFDTITVPIDRSAFSTKTLQMSMHTRRCLRLVVSTYNSHVGEFLTVKNFLNEYFDVAGAETLDIQNLWFFVSKDADNFVYGFPTLEISNVVDEETYRSVKKGVIWFIREFIMSDAYNTAEMAQWIRCHELSVMFRKTIDISEAIYAPFRGRKYQYDGSSRKPIFTTDFMVDSPPRIIEDVLRRQNWSEVESPPSDGWGKDVATAPLIDTSTDEGGFDHSSLDGLKTKNYARQILTKSDADTRDIVDDLCKESDCIQFPSANGNEQIAYLFSYGGSLATSITLDDILEVGDMIEPRPEDVFPEFFVRYDYDAARDKYNKVIQLTNIPQPTFDSSYIQGIGAVEGEDLWVKGHELWLKFGVTNTPPSDLTDLKWIHDDLDAIEYFENRLNWMPLRRVPFVVDYATGEDWFPGKHFGLELPHQTNNVELECVVERILQDTEGNRVPVQIIFLDELPAIQKRVKDTYQTPNTLADWKDAYTTKADVPAQGEDVVDSTLK